MTTDLTGEALSELFKLNLKSSQGPAPIVDVRSAIVEEALSETTRIRVEFMTRDRDLDMRLLLGQPVELRHRMVTDRQERSFTGICASVECIGVNGGVNIFVLEARSPEWLLSKQKNNMVLQGESTPDIVQKLLGDAKVNMELKLKLSGNYPAREYCVQYAETDYAFVRRLMEEDGIYYYFDHDKHAGTTMVLADSPGQHAALPNVSELEFVESFQTDFDFGNDVIEWSARGGFTTGHELLNSYDFEVPGKSLQVSRGAKVWRYPHSDLVAYTNTGRYADAGRGEQWARVRHEAETWPSRVWSGLTVSANVAPGYTFKLKNGPRSADPKEYFVTRAVHYMQRDADKPTHHEGDEAPLSNIPPDRKVDLGRHHRSYYRCEFEAIPKGEQFRPPRVTPWPNIGGIHTATVTGPQGEEIHTDKYGRIKIKFHWDLSDKDDDKSSIWVRTMMPWTGKNWGMIAVPRVGNEVVVQFEEGDPDRPLVIGMVYNGANMPPYALPDNKTVSGVKTNSSKGGEGYNELIFEDKKGDELIRFHAEKDYLQVVENNAKITIGKEKKDDGDLTQWVHRNRTSIVGLIDADATAGVKATAVGGAITETVIGVKATTVGYHVYEKIGFTASKIPGMAGVIGKQLAMKGGDTPSDVSKSGDSAFFDDMDQFFGATGVVKKIWSAISGYTAFAAPAAAAVIGSFKAKGLKPGRTTEIDGDAKLTIRKNGQAEGKSEITLEDGSMTTTIDKGHMQTIVKKGEHFTHVQTSDYRTTVSKGKYRLLVDADSHLTQVKKNMETTIMQGDLDTAVKMGDIKFKADMGAVTIEAMKSITLKVGQNKIEISQTGIKIDGMMINTKSKLTTEIDGGVMTTVKGTFVMIN